LGVNKIGRKIFYDLETGNVIVDTGERQGFVMATTIEQDVSSYKALSERNRETFDVIELPFGIYMQDFAICEDYKVNVETKKLEFFYPDPNDPQPEPVYQEPLSIKVKSLEERNMQLMLAQAELIEKAEQDKMNMQLTMAEMFESLINQGGM
jgi:hypothetical protein